MHALEGYFKGGVFYPLNSPVDIPDNRRVIVTVLDEQVPEGIKKLDTWAELDALVDSMTEHLDPENFTRCQLGRDHILPKEV